MHDKFYIWSNDCNMWWYKGGNGYTDQFGAAGIFTLDEAIRHIGGAFNHRCGYPNNPIRPADSLVPVNDSAPEQPNA